MILLRQKFCCDKLTFVTANMFVTTKVCLFVVANMLFVVTKIFWTKVSSWQAYFCCDKRCVLLQKTHICYNKTFVTTKMPKLKWYLWQLPPTIILRREKRECTQNHLAGWLSVRKTIWLADHTAGLTSPLWQHSPFPRAVPQLSHETFVRKKTILTHTAVSFLPRGTSSAIAAAPSSPSCLWLVDRVLFCWTQCTTGEYTVYFRRVGAERKLFVIKLQHCSSCPPHRQKQNVLHGHLVTDNWQSPSPLVWRDVSAPQIRQLITRQVAGDEEVSK